MLDSIRRILEQQEALRRIVEPLGHLPDLIDPLEDVYKQLGIGSETMQILQGEAERQKLLSGIVGGYRWRDLDAGATTRMLGADAERHRGLIDGPIEELRRSGLLDPDADLPRSIAAAIEDQQTYNRMFHRPELDGIDLLARQALSAGPLAASVFGGESIGSSLEAAMGAMRSSWLRTEHVERSACAFAEIQAMGRILNERPPFQAELAESLRRGLGDWRDLMTPAPNLLAFPLLRSGLYLERGFDPALTDFPVPAFEESLELAELRQRRKEKPGAADMDSAEDGFARAREAFDQLQLFENDIRRFIEKALHAAYGKDWMKRQLPNGMLEEWCTKRDRALKVGEVERPLIDYADFADYRKIIERKDNWNTVFKPVFGRPEDVRESFQRLFPVRIATMHARIVTLDDELLLLVETKRVLRAIQRGGC